jgi:hypothetical protein
VGVGVGRGMAGRARSNWGEVRFLTQINQNDGTDYTERGDKRMVTCAADRDPAAGT